MKRLGSSDSLGALMSMCPSTTDEHNQGNSHVYSREFQCMLEGLDEEGCVEESGHVSEKKRRLRVDQVKALEKNFEVENKLEPERKVKLAQELGLQPRQVAVWFQNRRARWKTKNLERDYNVLKANFDALKRNYESVQHDNEALLKEIGELKMKLNGESMDKSRVGVKEEAMETESDDDKVIVEQSNNNPNNKSLGKCEDDDTELNFESFNCMVNDTIFGHDFKDGSSDSDSSAILNEDNNNNSPNAAISSSGAFLISNGVSPSSSSLNCFKFFDSSSNSNAKSNLGEPQKKACCQPQFVKMEEHNFFSTEESCSTLFSDEQAPTLQWYCPEDWN